MNSFTVVPNYPLGTTVEFQTEDGELHTGEIVGVRVYKSKHFHSNGYMLYYIVDPYPGMEHDNQVVVPECHKKDLPRILGKAKA
jgi:hypothetical protein